MLLREYVLKEEVNIEVKDEDGFKENLYSLYKWEYIYGIFKTNPKLETDRRYQNIKKIIEGGLNDLVTKLNEDIKPVFEEWLENHAILSPETFAKKRTQDAEDIYGENAEDMISGFVADLFRLDETNTRRRVDPSEYYRFLNMRVAKSPEMLESIKNYLIDNAYQMVGEDEEDNSMQEMIDNDDLAGLFDNFTDALGGEELWIEILNYEGVTNTIENLYEYIYFPEWYGKWSAEGIDETREKIENIYKEIENADSYDLVTKLRNFNIAFNASHQTGGMIDYIGDRYDVDKAYLDYLSNIPEKEIKEWEQELKTEVLGESHKMKVKIYNEKTIDYNKKTQSFIYENPTRSETKDIPSWKEYDSVRGALNVYTDKLYVWDVNLLHFEVLDQIDPTGRGRFVSMIMYKDYIETTDTGERYTDISEVEELLKDSASMYRFYPRGFSIHMGAEDAVVRFESKLNEDTTQLANQKTNLQKQKADLSAKIASTTDANIKATLRIQYQKVQGMIDQIQAQIDKADIND